MSSKPSTYFLNEEKCDLSDPKYARYTLDPSLKAKMSLMIQRWTILANKSYYGLSRHLSGRDLVRATKVLLNSPSAFVWHENSKAIGNNFSCLERKMLLKIFDLVRGDKYANSFMLVGWIGMVQWNGYLRASAKRIPLCTLKGSYAWKTFIFLFEQIKENRCASKVGLVISWVVS